MIGFWYGMGIESFEVSRYVMSTNREELDESRFR